MKPNWTGLVKSSSQIGSLESIDLKNTSFTPYLQEDLKKPNSQDECHLRE